MLDSQELKEAKARFASKTEEINWLQPDAEMGCTKSQQRLGLIYFDSRKVLEDRIKAYKWLFISVALGNDDARSDLSRLHNFLDEEEVDLGFDTASTWLEEKYMAIERQAELSWSLELLRWRFSPSNVN